MQTRTFAYHIVCSDTFFLCKFCFDEYLVLFSVSNVNSAIDQINLNFNYNVPSNLYKQRFARVGIAQQG